MIGGAVGPADIGPLYNHGPELFPVVELIVGGGLPLAAALGLGRWRSVRARLAGGSVRATQAVAVEGDARSARGDRHRPGPPPRRSRPGRAPPPGDDQADALSPKRRAPTLSGPR